jgi:hypothetical protein
MNSRLLVSAVLCPLLVFSCAAAAPTGDLEKRIVRVAEKVTPSVVHIQGDPQVRRPPQRGDRLGPDRLGRRRDPDQSARRRRRREDHRERAGRKRKYPARLIGSDRQTDVALLRIDPDPEHRSRPRSSRPIPCTWPVGARDRQSYGLDGTVSLGIVSAKGRNLEIPDLLNDFIQTDALIDRGSSGGPLVDLDGRVVGINSRGQGRGIGFTIPIDTAREVMAQLDHGGIERGYLGVSLQPLDRDLADHLGLGDATGVLIEPGDAEVARRPRRASPRAT